MKKTLLALVLALSMLFSSMAFAETAEAPVMNCEALENIVANTFVGDFGYYVESFVLTLANGVDAAAIDVNSFSVEGHTKHPSDPTPSFGVYRVESDGADVTITVDPFFFNAAFIVRCTVDGEELFSFNSACVDETNIAVVDEFQALTTDAGMAYRLYTPESEGPLPLIVTFHGGGESGTDNLKQMVNNRITTKWAEEASQAQYPCVVLGPQSNQNWSDDELADIRGIIDELIADGVVDGNRVYAVGIAAFSSTLRFCAANTDLLAAALPMIAWAAYDPDLSPLTDLPMWFSIAANDPMGEGSHPAAQAEYIANELGNPNVRCTTYTDDQMAAYGLYGGLLHWGWVPSINNPEMVDWLFSFSK